MEGRLSEEIVWKDPKRPRELSTNLLHGRQSLAMSGQTNVVWWYPKLIIKLIPSNVTTSFFGYVLGCFCSSYFGCTILTNYLKAAIFMKLSNVPSAEPPLAVLIHNKVFLFFRIIFIVSHSYIRSADEYLSSGMGLVSASVSTYKYSLKRCMNLFNVL